MQEGLPRVFGGCFLLQVSELSPAAQVLVLTSSSEQHPTAQVNESDIGSWQAQLKSGTRG